MKQFYTLLAVFLLTATTWAQSPEKMSYQAVLRDGSNELLSEKQVGMQIRILQGFDPATATAVYTETQNAMTNVNGLLSLEIGTGATSDNFSLIDWSIGTYFIETNTDPLGGTDYSITGTSQLMSVPYALYAKTSGNGAGAQGPQGEQGIQGPAGNDGAVGATGAQGERGLQGLQGIAGTNGAVGADGAQGERGLQGEQGVQGAIGATGPQGIPGSQGSPDTTSDIQTKRPLKTVGGISIEGSGDIALSFPNADEVDDDSTAHKFVTAAEKTQITTNGTDIDALETSVFNADGSVVATGDFDLGAKRVTNLENPTADQDAATKAYVDALEAKLTALEDRIEALEPKIGDSYLGGILFYIYHQS